MAVTILFMEMVSGCLHAELFSGDGFLGGITGQKARYFLQLLAG